MMPTEKQKPLWQNKDPQTPCIYNAPEETWILFQDSNIKSQGGHLAKIPH